MSDNGTSPTLERIIAGPSAWPRTKHVRLADGSTVSVVVGENLYCTPRNDNGPYTHVEVGTWTRTPPSWAEYADYDHEADDEGEHLRVHGYVPVELVRALVAERGGEA